MLHYDQIIKEALKSALFFMVVLYVCVPSAYAGFEWTPPRQDLSSVPVVSSSPHQSVLAPIEDLEQQSDGVFESDSNVGVQALPSPEQERPLYDNITVHKMPSNVHPIDNLESQDMAIVSPNDKKTHLTEDKPLGSSLFGGVADMFDGITQKKLSDFIPAPLRMGEDDTVLTQPSTSDFDLESDSMVSPIESPRSPSFRQKPMRQNRAVAIKPYPDNGAIRLPIPSASFESPQASSSYDIVPGFGSDIPLIMALQQVVPARYMYVFETGLNSTQRVSWQGDRPWNIVLQDMVAPLGLQAYIQDNTVTIR